LQRIRIGLDTGEHRFGDGDGDGIAGGSAVAVFRCRRSRRSGPSPHPAASDGFARAATPAGCPIDRTRVGFEQCSNPCPCSGRPPS